MFKKLYLDKRLLIYLCIFFTISILSINSATKLLGSFYQNLAIKQIILYILGILVALFIMYIGNDKILDNIWYLYILGVIALIG